MIVSSYPQKSDGRQSTCHGVWCRAAAVARAGFSAGHDGLRRDTGLRDDGKLCKHYTSVGEQQHQHHLVLYPYSLSFSPHTPLQLPEFHAGNVGPPTASCEVKLKDVPEMNYVSSNVPPTGEVLMRGPTVFSHCTCCGLEP